MDQVEDQPIITEPQTPRHPYVPESLQLKYEYTEPVATVPVIIVGYFATVGLISFAVFLWARSIKSLTGTEKFLMCWLAWTAATHSILEAEFVIDDHFYANVNPYNVLAETWKEYAKADSRYASRDKTVLSAEILAAFFEGPLLALAIYGIAAKSSWRHVAIVIGSMGQLYGTVVYFYTIFTDDEICYRSEPMYYYFYLLFMNGIWLVVPTFCILYCSHELCKATAVYDRKQLEDGKKQE
eukprot:TRINITY_DN97_c0_g2_i1.p1 TRINITY_DN97_c0_g2~~TRINITY_DN97_c0_g2_i1.p1  ORF type:complete len:259 (+),score=21.48 TRINITY_DN97_c0_g2_i1:59-778(+)